MRILTLIVATGATLALVAPGAGAKNTLQCSSTAAVKAVAAQALQSAKAPASASSRLQHDRDSL